MEINSIKRIVVFFESKTKKFAPSRIVKRETTDVRDTQRAMKRSPSRD